MFKRRKPEDATPTAAVVDEPAEVALLPQPDLRAPPRPDNGLGVPPFRPASPPAPAKEVPMGRAPYPTAPTPGPQGQVIPQQPQQQPRPPQPRQPQERRTLVVGRGISVQGTVADAERLVVEGTVEASMIHAAELSIAHGGVFKGEVEVEDAEIAGVIDGTLTVRGNLVVRATGKVLGTARCRRLQVEDGGQITGRIEMLTEGARDPAKAEAAA